MTQFDEAVLVAGRLRQALAGVVEAGKIVAAGGEEAAHLSNRIIGVETVSKTLRVRDGSRCAAIRKRELFFAIGGVEPQERFGNAGIVGRDVADLERRHVDIREHRILQHGLQPRHVIGAAVAGEVGDVDLVGPRQPQQHVGRDRPLVALQQRDIGGRNIEIRGHVGLGQAEVAAEPAQARAHENGGRHRVWPSFVLSPLL